MLDFKLIYFLVVTKIKFCKNLKKSVDKNFVYVYINFNLGFAVFLLSRYLLNSTLKYMAVVS